MPRLSIWLPQSYTSITHYLSKFLLDGVGERRFLHSDALFVGPYLAVRIIFVFRLVAGVERMKCNRGIWLDIRQFKRQPANKELDNPLAWMIENYIPGFAIS